jgi:hypothetical protein
LAVINRTQALVLGFVAVAWISLLVILAVAPEIYDQSLRLALVDNRVADAVLLIALTAALVVLGIGVLRRWRWMFWLILVAFLAGVLRVPASALQLTGALPASGPAWYLLLQAAFGVAQFAIGLAMLAGYRRAGVWAAF